MAKIENLDGLIGSLYDAAMSPSLWPTVLTDLQDWIGASCGHFFIWDKHQNSAQFSVTNEQMEKAGQDYVQHYGQVDPRRPIMIQKPVGHWMACHEYFDTSFVHHNQFYMDFLKPLDLRYVTGTRVMDTGTAAAVMAFLRSSREGPFERPDIAALRRITAHFQRATQIQLRIVAAQRDNQTLAAALDRVPIGMIIADGKGRAVSLNRSAETILAACDGLCLRLGVLVADRSHEDCTLKRMISQAAQTAARRGADGGGTLQISRSSGRTALGVLVTPLGPSIAQVNEWQTPCVLILVCDRDRRPKLQLAHLQRLYGLTLAEARLSARLAMGQSLTEIADALGISHNTARKHLQNVTTKTGTHRQGDLVRLLLTGPALIESS